jgi:hypothetical protein
MAGQPLRGLVGQNMAGRRSVQPGIAYVFANAAAAVTFVPPVAGNWKFVGWGQGGAGSNGTQGGASGAYFEITKYITAATPVAVSVIQNGNTTVAFSDGTSATAAQNGGNATGGDVNLSGTVGTLDSAGAGGSGLGTGGGLGGAANATSAGGSGAPANLPFTGGHGGYYVGATYFPPGIGAGGAESNGQPGGPGQVIAMFVQ